MNVLLNTKQERTQFYDLAGGVLILWIMAFHAMNNCKVFGEADARVVLPFLTFSMPWFFYKSGLFFKVMPLCEGVAKDIRKLLIPFLKWSLAGYILYLLLLAVEGNFTWRDCVANPLETFAIYGYSTQRPGVVCLVSLFRTCHCSFLDSMAHTACSGNCYRNQYWFRAPLDGQPVAFLRAKRGNGCGFFHGGLSLRAL